MKKLLVAVMSVCVGCATSFTGDAHVEPAACHAKCSAANLHFVGMVYMGEYSSACICDVSPPTAAPGAAPGASAAATAASVGVVMQMRRQQQQQQQQQRSYR